MEPNQLTTEIIGSAIEVHRELGPGKPEIAYETALAHELGSRGLAHQVQKPVSVIYKGVKLECGYRLDVLVADTVVVEVKSVECVIPVHRSQVLTYLKLGGWRLALLLNFNVATLKQGIERFVLGFEEGERARIPVEESPATTKPPTKAAPSLYSTEDSGDKEAERVAKEIIAASAEVHRELGPGLLASAYEECLCHELHLRGLTFERKRPLELHYKSVPLAASDEVRLLVGGRVVVNPRAVENIGCVHKAQLLSQLRLGEWRLGLLINFNTVFFREGLCRIVLSGRSEGAAGARV